MCMFPDASLPVRHTNWLHCKTHGVQVAATRTVGILVKKVRTGHHAKNDMEAHSSCAVLMLAGDDVFFYLSDAIMFSLGCSRANKMG